MLAYLKSLWTWLYSVLYSLYAAWQARNNPVPVTPGGTFDLQATLKALILARNGAIEGWWPSQLNREVLSAEIHKLDDLQAAEVANLMINEANAHGISIAQVAGGSFQESQWDPACYNHNAGEYNGVITFEGTDWGFGQESGHNLPGLMADISTNIAAMSARAVDPNWSIPQLVGTYADNLSWANTLLDGASGASILANMAAMPSECIDPSVLSNRKYQAFWIAAGAYNAGRTGILNVIENQGMKIHYVKKLDGVVASTSSVPFVHSHHCYTWLQQFEPILEPPAHV